MTESADAARFVGSLLELGFSQYEARCYVGLLGPEPQTGYGVAKLTGVPQPKVYEALRKLVSRDAAREIAGEPVRFVAVPPDELFQDLEASFEARLAAARETSKGVGGPGSTSNLEQVERLDRLTQVIAACRTSIEAAQRRVYLSASAAELQSLRAPLEAALARGVDVVVLSFGRAPFELEGLQVFHHASTDGALYRHHQAHHVALVADSLETVYAVASDGKAWHGVTTASMPIIAAVKGFIRHDIDMQQVYADFGPQLVEAYGPGLQALESYRQDPTDRASSRKAAGRSTPTPARRRKTG
jgi:HTH-type transcriptional regulator, sugar sensing transcriptional regulator